MAENPQERTLEGPPGDTARALKLGLHMSPPNQTGSQIDRGGWAEENG